MRNKPTYLLIVCLLCSCNIFSTRTPAEPEDKLQGNSFLPFTSKENLITNFQNSVKTKNWQLYRACFIDTNYVFIPAGGARFLSNFSDWSVQSEENAFRALISNVKENSLRLVLSSQNPNISYPDSALLTSQYSLRISAAERDSVIAAGTMNLMMRQSRNAWGIQRWEDIGVEGDTLPSWTQLKVIR